MLEFEDTFNIFIQRGRKCCTDFLGKTAGEIRTTFPTPLYFVLKLLYKIVQTRLFIHRLNKQ